MYNKSFFRTLFLVSLGLSNPYSIGIANLPKESINEIRIEQNLSSLEKEVEEELVDSTKVAPSKFDYKVDIESLLMPKNKDLVRKTVYRESGNKFYAVSRCGAVGLMQLTPEMAVDYGISPDRIYKYEEYRGGCDINYGKMLIAARDSIITNDFMNDEERVQALIELDERFDPTKNMDVGQRGINDLLKRCKSPELALAVWNHGPTKVSKLVEKFADEWQDSLPGETKDFLDYVLE